MLPHCGTCSATASSSSRTILPARSPHPPTPDTPQQMPSACPPHAPVTPRQPLVPSARHPLPSWPFWLLIPFPFVHWLLNFPRISLRDQNKQEKYFHVCKMWGSLKREPRQELLSPGSKDSSKISFFLFLNCGKKHKTENLPS